MKVEAKSYIENITTHSLDFTKILGCVFLANLVFSKMAQENELLCTSYCKSWSESPFCAINCSAYEVENSLLKIIKNLGGSLGTSLILFAGKKILKISNRLILSNNFHQNKG